MRNIWPKMLGLALLVGAAGYLAFTTRNSPTVNSQKRAAVRDGSEVPAGSNGGTAASSGTSRPATASGKTQGLSPSGDPGSGVQPDRSSAHMPTASASATPPVSARELLNDVMGEPKATDSPGEATSLARTMHKRLQNELPDPDWAPYAEEQIRAYLANLTGDFASRFDIVGVECRATACEILLASKYLDQVSADTKRWQEVLYSGLVREPWWAQYQFEEPAVQVSEAPDSRRALLITYLMRKVATTG